MTDRNDNRLGGGRAFDQQVERAIDEIELRRATAGASTAAAALGGPRSGTDDAAAERAAFLTRYPFSRFWADLERRVEREEARGIRGWWRRLTSGLDRGWRDARVMGAVATVGVILVAGVLWLSGPFGTTGPDSIEPPGMSGYPEGVRPKGPPVPAAGLNTAKGASGAEDVDPVGIGFYVRSGNGAVPGTPGATYGEGDQFRFTYWSGSNDYLVLLSMEEDGAVSVYYPDETAVGAAGRSIEIPRGRNVPLDGSVILNDYVGKERFFALFSAEPIPLAQVKAAAARAVADLEGRGQDLSALDRLPIDVPQASFLIEKVKD